MSTSRSVKLADDEAAAVAALAESRARSANYIIRKAVQEYIERETWRDQVLKEAQASMANFRRTGKGNTLAAVKKEVQKMKMAAAKK